ncbi:SAM-dependent methyltransferase [Allocatelliglobosispora scoriae]|uniref:SAM-dependent methyltransferase n=1 Tax=Allocatelliglobosispora scoriae TaxID=643052 RepID=A0A841C2P8_9ACTN|nr:class I SAM-dependent methyltransferase [Allocatelliglobosispora scoriae]MBB5874038.1 SAM-dependent methyltransferase [Allocatelliglobosispora scoriae]
MQAGRETIDYDANGYDYRDYWQGRDYEFWAEDQALSRLVPRLAPARWFVDFGGAYGRNAPHYLRFAQHAVIMDYSATNLTNAAEQHAQAIATGRLSLVRCDLNAIPFRDNAFDSAMVIRVLHHLLDSEPALAEMSRTVSNRWLIDVPIKHHVLGLVRGARARRWREVRDEKPLITGASDEKYVNFSLPAVRRQLEQRGWQVTLAASVNNFRRWDYVLPEPTVKLARPIVHSMELATQRLGRGWWGPSQFLLTDRGTARPPGIPVPADAGLEARMSCPTCKDPLEWTETTATCTGCAVAFNKVGPYWDFVV